MPCYGNMGFLATQLVKDHRDVDALDGLIIPHGALRCGAKIPREIAKSIARFAEKGGLVIGMCDGAALLSKGVRKHGSFFESLGLLDAVFVKKYRCVELTIEIRESAWITKGLVGKRVEALHLSAYGGIEIGSARVLASSVNMHGTPAIIMGNSSNVVAIIPCDLLEKCSRIVSNIINRVGGDERVLERGRELWKKLCVDALDIGIGTGLKAEIARERECKRVVVITSTMEGEGKTLVATGLSIGLRMKGFRVALAKLGARATDLMPSLYALRKPFERDFSIKMQWRDKPEGLIEWDNALRALLKRYDVVLVEGFKGMFSGEAIARGTYTSTLSVVDYSKAPVIIVVSAERGFEDAVNRAALYVDELIGRGVEVLGVIVNMFEGGEQEKKYAREALKPLKVVFVRKDSSLEGVDPEEDPHLFALKSYELVGQSADATSMVMEAPCVGGG